jgi:ADP-heptose:LPS heptosyltransferase
VPPLILLNANCGDLLPLRRWSTDRYVELAKRLIERLPEARIVLTGAPNEAPQAEVLVADIDSESCVSMAGKTSLRQLLVLYGLAEVMVTNDSGPAHYATLTPIDVITLFGPETPAVFGARTPNSHMMWAGLACSPCVNAFNDRQSACRHNICMEHITVDMVLEKVLEVWSRRRRLSAE